MMLRAILPALAVGLAWAMPAAAQVDDDLRADFIATCENQMAEDAAEAGADIDQVCDCFANHVETQLSADDAAILMAAAAATAGPGDDFEQILMDQTGMSEAEVGEFQNRVMPQIGNVEAICIP